MLEAIIKFIAVYVIFLCAVGLWLNNADASSAGLIDLNELSINYKVFHNTTRNPLFTQSKPKEGINLNLNTDLLLGHAFWDNRIVSTTDDSQYRHIGWNFKLGTNITSFLTFQYEHFSQHLLDTTHPYMKFPVEDSLGFTLYLFRKDVRGQNILGF